MKLISLKAFKKRYFVEGEAPTDKTLKRWIEDQTIDGRKIGGKYFIDSQKFELTDNKLVNKVLMAS